jgi:hypothetical protein
MSKHSGLSEIEFTANPIKIAGTADPTAGGGRAAPEGSTYMRYVAAGGELYVKTGAANTAWAQVATVPSLSVFGADYQYAAQESRTSTTNDTTSPAVKTTLTTPSLTGTYLAWFCATIDSDNKEYFCDFYNLTDTTLLVQAANKTGVDTYLWDHSGFAQVTFAGAAKTFQIRWYNPTGDSNTLYIQRARIALWRVS